MTLQIDTVVKVNPSKRHSSPLQYFGLPQIILITVRKAATDWPVTTGHPSYDLVPPRI